MLISNKAMRTAVIIFIVMLLGIANVHAQHNDRCLNQIKVVRVDEITALVSRPLCHNFESHQLLKVSDTVILDDAKSYSKLLGFIDRSEKCSVEYPASDSLTIGAKIYLSYTNGDIDTLCISAFDGRFTMNGEGRMFTDEGVNSWIGFGIPAARHHAVKAHVGYDIHECMVGNSRECKNDSLLHVYNNSLFVSIPWVRPDSITLQADSASVVKKLFGVFVVKETSRRDSVKFRVYNSGRLVDSFVKYVRKGNIGPRAYFCKQGCWGGCYPVHFRRIKLEPPVRLYNDSIRYELLSFIADIYVKGRLIYSEYIKGDLVPDSVHDKMGPHKAKDMRIEMRAIVSRDQFGNVYVTSESFPETLWR